MAGKIISCVCCLLCAGAFYLIPMMASIRTPINFWSGDTTLKDKVKDIAAYNKEMTGLYRKYASVFLLAGVCTLLSPILGMALILLNCTLGILFLYRGYKTILNRYS